MIESHPAMAGGPAVRLVLRPPRALSGRQFGALFAVLSGTMWVVALLGAWQGNVFAPPFALAHSLIVAAALRWVWRLGGRREQIDVDATTVSVRRLDDPSANAEGRTVFQAHPYWVRLSVGQAGHAPHVLLDSRGVRVEVGGFLAPDEREELAGKLQDALRVAAGRATDARADDATSQT
ncbi:MAG: DUF2244 domain-containing protein [Proteobacteria bacterium]|nr:DUF2244 domain-containing protein [Pseudomonadota bacterium]